MSSIDKRIVQMEFENQQFERNAKTTIKTMDELKKNMDFKSMSSSLKEFDNTSKHFNLGGISSAVSSIADRFSNMGIIGVTALQRITNKAIDAGERIARALTIEPVSTGFDEYELKMGSVQTIMASTGESLETVNKYLEELNKYSDKTIYSFSDMTQNIGKFTNAGVELKDAVKAIQGISNEAAVSGANAQEASRAMYNFAQALSAGYVKLIDWKSIENANMATVEFKKELMKTAVEIGTLTQQGDRYVTTTTDMNGKVSEAFTATSLFNESLSAQWMTTDVLTKTLGRYADETTVIGKKAFAAAQDVKTLSMLFDTLKEAVQSGWAQTWELIIGDFDEAKELFTLLSDVFGDVIAKAAEARNLRLKEWFDLGGRDVLIASLLNVLTAINETIKPIKAAFREIFPKKTTEQMKSLIDGMYNFTKSLIPSQERMEQFKRIAKGVFAVIDVGKTIITTLVKAGFKLLGAVLGESTDDIVELVAKVGDLLVRFRDWFKSSTLLNSILDAVIETVRTVVKAIRSFISYIMEIPAVNSFVSNFGDNLASVFQWISTKAKSAGEKIGQFFDYFRSLPPINSMEDLGNNLKIIGTDIANYFTGLFDSTNGVKEGITNAFSTIMDKLGPVGDAFLKLWEIIKNVFDWIVNLLKGADFGNLVFAGVGVGVIASLAAIAKAIEAIANVFSPLTKVLSGAGDALKAFSVKLKAEALKTVAEAILILVGALAVLCLLPEDRLWGSVAILGGLIGGMIGLEKAAGKMTQVDWSITGNILALAIGAGILTAALNALEVEGIGAKLSILTLVIAELGGVGIAMSKLGAVKDATSNAAMQVVGMAAAIWIIAHSFQTLASISDQDIGRGLAVVETVIVSLTIFSALTNRAGKIKIGDFANIGGSTGGGSANTNITANNSSGASGILAAAVAIHIIISAFKRLSDMDPGAIVTGLAVMEIIFINFIGLMAATRLAGEHAAKAGASMLMISLALLLLSPALKGLGSIEGGELAKALAAVIAIGAIMAALIIATEKAGKHGGSAALTMIGFSAALLLIPISIKLLAGIAAGDLLKGLAAIAAIGLICSMLIQSMRGVRDIHKNLLMLTILIGVVGGIFIALAVIDTGNTAAIGLALAAVIGSLAILAKSSGDLELDLASTAILILLVAAVGSIFALILSVGKNLDSALEVGVGLSAVIIALAAAMKLMSKTSAPSKGALVALGVMAAIMSAVGLVIALLCGFENIDQALGVCIGLSTLVISMSAALALLSLVGSGAPAALAGAGAMIAIIGVLGTALFALGELATWLESKGQNLFKMLDLGIKVFEKVGEAIGALIGGVIEGIGEGVATTIERIGTALGNFANGAQPFLDLANTVDSDKMAAISSLADAIATLTTINWALLPTKEDLSTAFTNIGEGLTAFAEATSTIDAEAVESAANAGKMLSELESSTTGQGGLLQDIIGTKDLGDFGTRMKKYAEGLTAMATELAKVPIDPEVIETATNCGKMMAELENSLPAQGGILQDIIGTKDLGDFGHQMAIYAFWMGSVQENLSKNPIDPAAVEVAKNCGAMMSELENGLAAHGGVVQFFTGDQDLATFGKNIADFGTSLVTFTGNIKDLDASKMTDVMTIAQTLSDFENGLRQTGGVVSWFTGDGALDTFGANMESFGASLFNFFNDLSLVEIPDTADDILDYVIKLSDATLDFRESDLSIGGVFRGTVEEIINFITSVPEDNEYDLKMSGSDIMNYFIQGIENGTVTWMYKVTNAAEKIASNIIEIMKTELDEHSPSVVATKIGRYFDEGLAIGIAEDDSPEKATLEKAKDINTVADLEGEKTHKKMVMIGHYTVKGLAEGIEAEDSAEERAKKKAENISKAFENGFKQIEINTNLLDLTEQIWELTEGKDATEAEKTQHQIENKIKQLEQQAQKVQDTQAVYRTKAETLGKDSLEAQEAYNDWLQTQVDLHTMANEITELQNGTLEVTRGMIEDSTKSYLDFMKNSEIMLASGMSIEEIQKAARERSGMEYILNPPKEDTRVNDIVSSALQDVEVEIAKDIEPTIKKAVSGTVKNAVNQAVPEVSAAGENVGGAINEGLANGLDKKQRMVDKRLEESINGFKNSYTGPNGFDINSPSRFTRDVGMSLCEGLILGFQDMFPEVYNTLLGGTNKLKDLLSDLPGRFKSLEMTDITPTITPVVDLTNVNNAARQIDSSLGSSNAWKLDAVFNKYKTQKIAGTMYYDDPASPLKPGASSVTNNYNFTQNNTSPKALSRTEIYRQTNNQFSLLKNIMTTAASSTALVLRGGK